MRGKPMSRLTLCGVVSCLTLVAPAARADDAEDKAVAFVEKLGGKVTRDEKLPGKPVVAVNLRNTFVKDADLKELAAFKSLTTLDLSGNPGVTDDGMQHLVPLKNLTD